MSNIKNITRKELPTDIVITLAVALSIGGSALASLSGIEWLATLLLAVFLIIGLIAAAGMVLGSLLALTE